ncbi:hypothetical protein ABXV18_27060 [Vibrio owensii]|uniref:hypothetical protein n=1 Tax=Vibrio owensii TaxID=696485 RepID=UPI0033998714
MTKKSKQPKNKMIPLVSVMGDIGRQQAIADNIERTIERARIHATYMYLYEHNGIDILSPPFLPITDPNYQPPSKELLQKVVDLLEGEGVTKTDISRNLGVTTDKNRTLLYWLAENKTTVIPYSAWRQLTNLAGLTLTTALVNDRHLANKA